MRDGAADKHKMKKSVSMAGPEEKWNDKTHDMCAASLTHAIETERQFNDHSSAKGVTFPRFDFIWISLTEIESINFSILLRRGVETLIRSRSLCCHVQLLFDSIVSFTCRLKGSSHVYIGTQTHWPKLHAGNVSISCHSIGIIFEWHTYRHALIKSHFYRY